MLVNFHAPGSRSAFRQIIADRDPDHNTAGMDICSGEFHYQSISFADTYVRFFIRILIVIGFSFDQVLLCVQINFYVSDVRTVTYSLSCAGQEIEKETAQPPDLQIIQSRIRDIIHVLQDFRWRTLISNTWTVPGSPNPIFHWHADPGLSLSYPVSVALSWKKNGSWSAIYTVKILGDNVKFL